MNRRTPRPGKPGGTILVAEDEDSLLRLVAAALESNGFDVLEARTGNEALEIVARPDLRVDLLLTDVTMPHMNGRELAERSARLQPGLKILFMSGDIEDKAVRRRVTEPGAAFIEKPFRIEALVRKVSAILKEAPPGGRGSP